MNSIELLKKMIGNSIVTIKFLKKNGEERILNGRFGVRKHLKGVGLSYNPEDNDNLIIYDLKNKGYRTININRILEIKSDGKVISFDK